MRLAKNVIDAGLSTNNLEPMLQFWQQDAAKLQLPADASMTLLARYEVWISTPQILR